MKNFSNTEQQPLEARRRPEDQSRDHCGEPAGPIQVFGATHQGLTRPRNEDRLLIVTPSTDATLLAVIDGLGGQPGGELAAQLAKQTLQGFRLQPGSITGQLRQLFATANQTILTEAEKRPEYAYMGATITAALVRNSTVYWIHVGDCRLYLLGPREFSQITSDQNMAQFMVEEGKMSLEEARNSPMQRMLDQCVGSPYCEPVCGMFSIDAQDLLLLCTDGIHNELSQTEITETMARSTSLPEKGEDLIKAALKAGGRDNIAVILATLRPAPHHPSRP